MPEYLIAMRCKQEINLTPPFNSLVVVEKYFDMKKNQCKEGLDIYKKFLTRMTRISEFLKVAEVKCQLSARGQSSLRKSGGGWRGLN